METRHPQAYLFDSINNASPVSFRGETEETMESVVQYSSHPTTPHIRHILGQQVFSVVSWFNILKCGINYIIMNPEELWQ